MREEVNTMQNVKSNKPAERTSDRAATTTTSMRQSADEAAKSSGADTSQPRRGDGTYPPDGRTPIDIPKEDLWGSVPREGMSQDLEAIERYEAKERRARENKEARTSDR
jgi:hypothetical protein